MQALPRRQERFDFTRVRASMKMRVGRCLPVHFLQRMCIRRRVMKMPAATLATALVAATVPSLPTTAHAFGFHGGWGGFHGGGGWGGFHRGWGWGGVGLGLATGALVGAALAAPYYDYGYGPYAYDYGYPVYGPGYAYDYDVGPAYTVSYDYAPSYGYASYGYAPSCGYAYAAPSWGYRHYAYRQYGYRHFAAAPIHRAVRTAYASYRPGHLVMAHGGSMNRIQARHR